MLIELNTWDFFYIAVSIGFVVLVVYLVLLVKRLFITLDKLDAILDDVKNTTDGVRDLKDQAKATFYTAASSLLGIFFGQKGKGVK